jgi:hypothetical protein
MLRLAFLALLAIAASAQTITATLTGAVRDPQGAAFPAVAITVTSVRTAQQTVEVHEDASMLVTETSHLETTVENKLIAEFPTGERSTLSFLNLVPGAINF